MVELESVSFHYGREDAGMLLTGVEDISFKIEKGQCAVLCGRYVITSDYRHIGENLLQLYF